MIAASDEKAIRAALEAGMAHHNAGHFDEAAAVYRQVLEVSPRRPEPMALLAAIAHGAGRPGEAAELLTRAVAIFPENGTYHHRLGLALEELGRFDEALVAHANAIGLGDVPGARAGFARGFALAQRMPGDARLITLVVHAIVEAWVRPADLAGSAISLVRASPLVHDPIESAGRGQLTPAATDALLARRDVVEGLSHPLLVAVLENTQVCDWRLECFLTAVREALLRAVASGSDRPDLLFVACAIARQCFLNDYVYSTAPDESRTAAALAGRLVDAARAGKPLDAVALAVVAAYVPLHSLDWPADFAQRAWPAPVQALIRQQILEPRAERELRDSIPRLGAIDDDVSLQVQRQYEQSPYPRWVRLPPGQPLTFAEQMGALFPGLEISRGTGQPTDVLVAGCGTGQESMDIAQGIASSRVLAIDLSIASLAYAKRKAIEARIGNIEYAQGDILAFESPRTFDFVSSVGVLHHLRDPLAGWRRLAAMLKPGGIMQVGLYSEEGRRDLAPARALIAERGWKPEVDDIRRARAEILPSPQFSRVAALRDMYGTNECRDLLFHVQEHRYRLPEVRAMAESLRLEPLGLAVPAAIARAFHARFGAARTNDLDAWDEFERAHPDTFSGMYILWLRKS
jgi:SAM-dependent methyltransferase